MDPWGTPCVTISSSERDVPSRVDCIRSVGYLSNQFDALLDSPSRLQLKKECPMTYVIKSFAWIDKDHSRYFLLVHCFKNMTSNKQTQGFSRVVFVIPALVAGRLPSWGRKSMNGFKAIFSVSLESTGSNVVIRNLVISILEVRHHL